MTHPPSEQITMQPAHDAQPAPIIPSLPAGANALLQEAVNRAEFGTTAQEVIRYLVIHGLHLLRVNGALTGRHACSKPHAERET